jgi:hypothetical protein
MTETKRQKESAFLKRIFNGIGKTERNNELIKETIELYQNGQITQLDTARNLLSSLIGTKTTKASTVKKIDELKKKKTNLGRLDTKKKQTFHVTATVVLQKTYTHKTYTKKRTGDRITREIPVEKRTTEIDELPISTTVKAYSIDEARQQF